MCMEDVRIGRKTDSRLGSLTLTGGVQNLVQHDPNRVSLTLFAPATGVCYLRTDDAITTTNAIAHVAGMNPIILTVQEHGQIVTRAWFVAGTTIGTVYPYIEGNLEAQ